MLDINQIRENSGNVIEMLSVRGEDFTSVIEEIKKLDSVWRLNLKEAEKLKAEKNSVSEQIGELKREGKDASGVIKKMQEVASRIKELDEKVKNVKSELDNKQRYIPNIPAEGIRKVDRIVREEGKKKDFSDSETPPLPHWDIGEMLKIIDLKTATKLSGSRFPLLKGEGAELERALITFMLDIHRKYHGYTEIMPPYLVKEEIMTGTGQMPKFGEDMYNTKKDNLYLIPTAEVPLTNMHREEIIGKEDLPKKYMAYTPCFRREAGSYGKDTGGLIRNHQFNKVELVNIVLPEESDNFHRQLLSESEEVLKRLGLTYRVLELGTCEIGFSATKTYDLEVWMPGEKKWREVSSCSNCRDFQARRMALRYRKEDGNTEYLHTLNSSGVAVGRIFAAILENFQTDEINVIIPKAIRKYIKRKTLIA
ncbi:MAG: serine--tRNA ligase [Elusimicrobia bacterium]|jgi:seryl-tRNA synthetase|nr:serine--tRNA ligase [Elusimicrobiota bacterium]